MGDLKTPENDITQTETITHLVFRLSLKGNRKKLQKKCRPFSSPGTYLMGDLRTQKDHITLVPTCKSMYLLKLIFIRLYAFLCTSEYLVPSIKHFTSWHRPSVVCIHLYKKVQTFQSFPFVPFGMFLHNLG